MNLSSLEVGVSEARLAATRRASTPWTGGGTTRTPSARLGHRDDIQGLRAVAVLLVVLNHAGVRILRGGFIGVDVFFVLSGFLITRLLIDGAERDGAISLRSFYARRAKRILPAATLTLVAIDLAASHLMNSVRGKQAIVDSLWASVFAANVRFAHQGMDYFAQGQPPSPVQHFWSLAVEEQFYLLWPVVLAVLLAVAGRRRGRRGLFLASTVVSVALLSLGWSILDTATAPAAAYFSAPARAWELLLGAGLAIGAAGFLRLSNRSRALMGWTGMAAIGAAAMAISESTPFPGWAAILPTIGAALVIAAGIGDDRSPGGVGGFLGHSSLRYVGDRSYAFYLWHWPVLVIAAAVVGHELSLSVNSLLLTGAFLLSMASFRGVENPIRRATLWTPLRTTSVLWCASVALVVIAAFVGQRAFGGVVDAADTPRTVKALPPLSRQPTGGPAFGAIPAVVEAVQAAQGGEAIPASLVPPLDGLLDDRYEFPDPDCFARHGEAVQGSCTLKPGRRTMVVVGDSHAREWMPAIEWAAERDGWSVVPLVETGCRPSDYARGCNAYYRWALAKIGLLHPDLVVIGGHLRVSSPELIVASLDGTEMILEDARPFAGRVILIGDPPGTSREPVDCLLSRGATLATCLSTLSASQIAVYTDAQRLASAHGAGFIDTISWFCFHGRCPAVVGQTVVHRDTDHITRSYAFELRELFLDALRQAMLS